MEFSRPASPTGSTGTVVDDDELETEIYEAAKLSGDYSKCHILDAPLAWQMAHRDPSLPPLFTTELPPESDLEKYLAATKDDKFNYTSHCMASTTSSFSGIAMAKGVQDGFFTPVWTTSWATSCAAPAAHTPMSPTHADATADDAVASAPVAPTASEPQAPDDAAANAASPPANTISGAFDATSAPSATSTHRSSVDVDTSSETTDHDFKPRDDEPATAPTPTAAEVSKDDSATQWSSVDPNAQWASATSVPAADPSTPPAPNAWASMAHAGVPNPIHIVFPEAAAAARPVRDTTATSPRTWASTQCATEASMPESEAAPTSVRRGSWEAAPETTQQSAQPRYATAEAPSNDTAESMPKKPKPSTSAAAESPFGGHVPAPTVDPAMAGSTSWASCSNERWFNVPMDPPAYMSWASSSSWSCDTASEGYSEDISVCGDDAMSTTDVSEDMSDIDDDDEYSEDVDMSEYSDDGTDSDSAYSDAASKRKRVDDDDSTDECRRPAKRMRPTRRPTPFPVIRPRTKHERGPSRPRLVARRPRVDNN